MSDQPPFSLHIFIADGDPDGLRIVERDNWIGKAIVFPRPLFTQVRSMDEFNQTGVYLLIGPRENGEGEMIYIGEGDPIKQRLESHYAKKDFWTRAVFFIASQGRLNKAHVQYLEAQLINRANTTKRTLLENANSPSEPTLSMPDRAYLDVFLQNMLGMLPVLGIHAFEQSPSMAVKDKTTVLTCHGRDISATGYDTPQGFVVQSGSFAANEEVASLQTYYPYIRALRADLIKKGVLQLQDGKLKFTQDFVFSSPSTASTVVLARSSNGRTSWKDASGRTLKEIQQAQAEPSSNELLVELQ